jgi:NAD(P) transhydrogenase subunit alpha
MRLTVLKERRAGETRVAATPETVKKLIGLGITTVAVETGAGVASGFTDAAYHEAGAEIAADVAAALAGANIVLKVRAPLGTGEGEVDELSLIPRGALLIGTLEGLAEPSRATTYAGLGIDAASMELLPRITRAQSMDILSSQANLAGYRAVIEGATAFDKGFPMLMTAAGTIPAANVFVMGAGVAGLQAIATGRRLGGRVSATDVRPAAKEEIKSLGASFVGYEDEESKAAQTAGGYAKQLSADFYARQAEVVAAHIAKQDVVVTTALVQGRKAPTLVTAAMVASMKPGSVIVDIAADAGAIAP